MFAIPHQLAWPARDIVDIGLAEELWIEFHAMVSFSETPEYQP